MHVWRQIAGRENFIAHGVRPLVLLMTTVLRLLRDHDHSFLRYLLEIRHLPSGTVVITVAHVSICLS